MKNLRRAVFLSLGIYLIFFVAFKGTIFQKPSSNTLESSRGSVESSRNSVEGAHARHQSLQELIKKPFAISQDDPRMIELLRSQFLVPPSNNTTNTYDVDSYASQFDEDVWLLRLLRGKKNGFFVECGAFTGLIYSNTIFFEGELNWHGLLIEAGPKNYEGLSKANRKAWRSNTCLSLINSPNEVTFNEHNLIGGISVSKGLKKWMKKTRGVKIHRSKVQCFPFYSYLLALNRTQVDYFSLDIEGGELDVLKTIPWDLVQITALSVEYANSAVSKEETINYLKAKGYKLYHEIENHDVIMYHSEYIKSLK